MLPFSVGPSKNQAKLIKKSLSLLTELEKEDLVDENLIRSYLSNQDERHFNIIYTRYAGKIYGKCLSFFKDDLAARDAVHDIFLKILLNLARFDFRSKFSTWVYAITYNHCIDQIRKNKKLDTISKDFSDHGIEIAEEVDDDWITGVKPEEINQTLDKLIPTDKAILLMKYMDELSIKEICDITQKSESAIKMRLKRAKYKFKEAYVKMYKPEL